MKIEITRDVIESARRLLQQTGELSTSCPIAFGIRQTMLAHKYPKVKVSIGAYYGLGEVRQAHINGAPYSLPTGVGNWISRFDGGEEVGPITFDLPIKESHYVL